MTPATRDYRARRGRFALQSGIGPRKTLANGSFMMFMLSETLGEGFRVIRLVRSVADYSISTLRSLRVQSVIPCLTNVSFTTAVFDHLEHP
jgi:hypothetical protein